MLETACILGRFIGLLHMLSQLSTFMFSAPRRRHQLRKRAHLGSHSALWALQIVKGPSDTKSGLQKGPIPSFGGDPKAQSLLATLYCNEVAWSISATTNLWIVEDESSPESPPVGMMSSHSCRVPRAAIAQIELVHLLPFWVWNHNPGICRLR